MNMHVPTLQRSLPDVVAEYDVKKAALPDALRAFEKAGGAVKMAATIGGTFGRGNIDAGNIHERELADNLLTSAWLHVYEGLNIHLLASPNDKRRFEQAMAKPPAFTIDNIRATFGHFIQDPRGNILRGLAEVFCDLDQAYKSHEKVRIGVAGLPKRVVISGFGSFSYYGRDRVGTILNALAVYQGKPLVTHRELAALLDNENALIEPHDLQPGRYETTVERTPGRGVRLRQFKNGNGHLFFEPDTLRDINMALAEFYGDVLPDCAEAKPERPRASTAVSKDLQYYPTPVSIAERVVADVYGLKGARVLEPSCGDGRLMDALRKAGAKVYGIEVEPLRAAAARAKGHAVLTANFLETVPTGDYDHCLLNPPFFRTHYFKHVEHALKFLKPGGTLTAILPATARYDHGLLDGKWEDLPVGSFSESGTNINVSVLTIRIPG